jgi:hypothetical protein
MPELGSRIPSSILIKTVRTFKFELNLTKFNKKILCKDPALPGAAHGRQQRHFLAGYIGQVVALERKVPLLFATFADGRARNNSLQVRRHNSWEMNTNFDILKMNLI